MEISPAPQSAQAWTQATDAAKAGLQQSWTYGEVLLTMGKSVHRIARDGKPHGQWVTRRLLGGRRLAVAMRGPMDGQLPPKRALKNALEMPRASLLLAAPDDGETARSRAMMTGGTMARLALQDDPEVQLAMMHGKWRNRLRAATPVPVHRFDRDAGVLAQLIAHDLDQQKRQNYRALPPEFLITWAQIAPQDMAILAIQKQGVLAAGMVFLRHGVGVTYQLGWAGAWARKNHAHNLLLWHAMQLFANEGARFIDLGLLDTERAPGLARFKLGAGAEALKLGATRRLA